MGIFIGFLTVILVLNCLLLILLVLIQLPKKEAGAGIAFGGGAADTLFGAGSGNALTKITKYSASVFLGLSLVLSVLNTGRSSRAERSVNEQLQQLQTTAQPTATTPAPTNAIRPLAAPVLNPLLTTNVQAATNASTPAGATNAAPLAK
jgi:preprotein translocase subunit SecG